MVWQIIPEEVYVGRDTLQLGLYGAVDHFNIGLITVTVFPSPRHVYTNFKLLFLEISNCAVCRRREQK